MLEFTYPGSSESLYIPVEMDGRKGRVVFEVVHRDPAAHLFWHLDENYVGATDHYHQFASDIAPGWHQITVVDAQGNRLTRRFEVLVRGEGYTQHEQTTLH
jgi:penicillin-binding protein 1C